MFDTAAVFLLIGVIAAMLLAGGVASSVVQIVFPVFILLAAVMAAINVMKR